MAAVNFVVFSLTPKPASSFTSPSTSLSSAVINGERFSRRRSMFCAFANPNPSPELDKPYIELEFIGPKAEADGSYPVDRTSAISGEKLLRNIMLDNKIELYAAYGKIMNCGGGGSCGTCIVEIVDGKDLLNERTDTEKRYLKKKPESWRLACQTIVGNKENSGKVIVQRLPQWKK
ncbi:photosynthetic NDH subunit of subcomplex B 3, chloroplastic isoform X2 [Dendrobium catenatum]|uniref:2Fe-2S ferredoxin-type domain-containing protein n=1 Tax=Dendrobium catenatum TaxID=906689 RepID=A0A2I0WJT4_9ASPA|nr:photosynthetic NDH subunit of subcomplex B 3, chloroplastic isoform X2 [Dendrobium catenatum]XP_020698225.1 photosynthetic NDH subunit of subcomplex B 3, chloroplastic isoform X2 [Dendrobium catenatum]XP_028552275.1 photosynthetic NDH subunit of subcomplex B 3, chloroplastic isoform X2 [Dendrobium catenatum]XP_028552276.1 photosynthetic NDH subunit of subcomplex B 3, chloroplastic isoform X2 [Dendrobium catenatum]XP_028552277.1 photosynthetic NDH subunit of subcomplex B 3, chloroplastic isof